MFNNNGRSAMPSTGLEGLEPEEVAGDPAKGEVAQAPANALMLAGRSRRRASRSADPDERLAAVLAAEHPDERGGRVLEPLGHVLAVGELALGEPAAEALQALGEAMDVVVDQEPLEPRAEDDQEAEVARRELRLGEVVLRDLPADRDAGAEREPPEDRLGERAADVVEVDVDAVRARLLQPRVDVVALVVDADVVAVEARSGRRPSRPTRRARRPGRSRRSSRAGRRSGRRAPGRSGDDDGVARLRPRRRRRGRSRR